MTSATASVKVKWLGIYQYLTAVRSEVLSPKKEKKTPSQSIILQIAYSYIYTLCKGVLFLDLDKSVGHLTVSCVSERHSIYIRTVIGISSGQRNLMKTYHNEANTGEITKKIWSKEISWTFVRCQIVASKSMSKNSQ